MAISDEDLEYIHHLESYEKLGLLTGNEQEDAYWHRKAEYQHALSVTDAIFNMYGESVILSQKLKDPEANMQLRFGVARRMKFLWLALQSLIGLIHPEREEPLPRDEVEQAASALNAIYINIRGTLDNFAWCLLYLIVGKKIAQDTPPGKVNLLSQEFLKIISVPEFSNFLQEFTSWGSELRKRRDPAAHRIPLSIPPAIIDNATREEYERIKAKYNEAVNRALNTPGLAVDNLKLFEEAEILSEQLERLGRFLPLFGHHPSEGLMKIYPTVPEDMGKVVKISRGLSATISGRWAA